MSASVSVHPRLLAMACLLAFAACEDEPKEIQSVVLMDGAYIRITNHQDSTSLAMLDGAVFSLEIRAAGDTLPPGVVAPPALFMISNSQGGDELGVYRISSDSSGIKVYMNHSLVGRYSIPSCNWNDPDRFTQVVVTYDMTTVRVYGNGAFLGSQSNSVGLDIAGSDGLIGADWDALNDVSSLGNFWYGAIDEVRLWTIALPQDEMGFRYRNPKNLTRYYSDDGLEPLLGLWRFNEEPSDGRTVTDRSDNGNSADIRISGSGNFYFSTSGAE